MRIRDFRRIVGLAMLLVTPASSAEAVVGVVRDGAVHHETTTAAAAHHPHGPQQGHGHEDAVPTHQHGTAADHCTHVHGVAFPATVMERVEAFILTREPQSTVTHRVRYRTLPTPPPKA